MPSSAGKSHPGSEWREVSGKEKQLPPYTTGCPVLVGGEDSQLDCPQAPAMPAPPGAWEAAGKEKAVINKVPNTLQKSAAGGLIIQCKHWERAFPTAVGDENECLTRAFSDGTVGVPGLLFHYIGGRMHEALR